MGTASIGRKPVNVGATTSAGLRGLRFLAAASYTSRADGARSRLVSLGRGRRRQTLPVEVEAGADVDEAGPTGVALSVDEVGLLPTLPGATVEAAAVEVEASPALVEVAAALVEVDATTGSDEAGSELPPLMNEATAGPATGQVLGCSQMSP